MSKRRMSLWFVLHGMAFAVLVAAIWNDRLPRSTGLEERIGDGAFIVFGCIPGLLLGALTAFGTPHAMHAMDRLAAWRNPAEPQKPERQSIPPFAFGFAAGICTLVVATGVALLGMALGIPLARWIIIAAPMGPPAGILMGVSLVAAASWRRRRARAGGL